MTRGRIPLLFGPFVAALAVGGGLLYFVQQQGRNHTGSSPSESASPGKGFQCAHWSIFRTCQLVGVPVGPTLLQELPPTAQGHSLEQVARCLDKLGISATGFRDDWNFLAELDFPCIAHLRRPDHYVVISGIEAKKGLVHIFDDEGHRTRRTREAFESRWSGITLHVRKKVDATTDRGIQLDYLLLDKGDIPAVGKRVEFAFPFHNTGDKPLTLKEVKVNCRCLRSEKPQGPIPPGKTGVVKLFYDVEPKKGAFAQTALVTTDSGLFPHVVLAACGYSGVEVYLSPSYLSLDKLFLGRDCTAAVTLHYTGEWENFEVDVGSSDLTNAELRKHECSAPDRTAPSRRRQAPADKIRRLAFTFRPSGRLGDRVEGVVKVKTNIKGYETFHVHVSGEIESPVKAYPGILLFDAVGEKGSSKKQVTLVSRCDEPFRILDVEIGGDPLADEQVHYEKTSARQITLIIAFPFETLLSYEGNELHVRVKLEQSGQELLLPLDIAAAQPAQPHEA